DVRADVENRRELGRACRDGPARDRPDLYSLLALGPRAGGPAASLPRGRDGGAGPLRPGTAPAMARRRLSCAGAGNVGEGDLRVDAERTGRRRSSRVPARGLARALVPERGCSGGGVPTWRVAVDSLQGAPPADNVSRLYP